MRSSKTALFAIIGLIGLTALLHSSPCLGQQRRAQTYWRGKLHAELPLLGHRNWILIVDSAYPLQTSQGIETVETESDQIEVVNSVLKELAGTIHVRPVVYMDSELSFLDESDAPGVSQYKHDIAGVLGKRPVSVLPHEEMIAKIDEAGRNFHVLILKTKLAVPYTSVFLQLNCKYWGDSAEASLRAKMKRSHF